MECSSFVGAGLLRARLVSVSLSLSPLCIVESETHIQRQLRSNASNGSEMRDWLPANDEVSRGAGLLRVPLVSVSLSLSPPCIVERETHGEDALRSNAGAGSAMRD